VFSNEWILQKHTIISGAYKLKLQAVIAPLIVLQEHLIFIIMKLVILLSVPALNVEYSDTEILM